MFGKKNPKEPNQSQSMSGVNVSGGVVQQGQAGRDLQQSTSGNLQARQQITAVEVLRQLEKLEKAVNTSTLALEKKEEILDYLRPARREAAKDGANKDLVGQNLKQVNETLKTVKETTEVGKSLWQTGQEVFTAIAPWLGAAAKLIGL
ncbi:hypothetical protein V0288_09475 [Pannus brasiliensis CCIBt3594]|uniref:Uncharacterized protein n=1 Tax=Pannus brasiliensis CCIBt3594 TaxID=1427578 RepID=A0AAW9QV79_9CHRO